jgi:hypothetical protein
MWRNFAILALMAISMLDSVYPPPYMVYTLKNFIHTILWRSEGKRPVIPMTIVKSDSVWITAFLSTF